MKYPIKKRSHLIKEVTIHSLTFQFEPHCGQWDIWLRGGGGGGGGKLAKEVAFAFMFLLLF